MKKNKKTSATVATQPGGQIVARALETLMPFQSVMMNIALDQIDPNPFNPRKEFVEENLAELADSIRRHGVQTDIKVRPMDNNRYQIVYGERRWRAAQMAALETIPAKVEAMTDPQAETAAIIENMQRENFSPFEEAQIFRRMSEERAMSVAQICELFAKREDYVRIRMNLTKLIPDVAELLRHKEITLEVAKEFANYNEDIQKEVFSNHFSSDGYQCWKGIPAKEFAKRLYSTYMTKLDGYCFDKTECETCGHNTLNQVLFNSCGDCAGCRNMECLQRKNTAYLVDIVVAKSAEDPRLHIAANDQSNPSVIDRLTEMGYDIQVLDMPVWRYSTLDDAPQIPDAELYEDEDDLQLAMEDYRQELEEYNAQNVALEAAINDGTTLKLLIVGSTDIDIRFEEVKSVQVEVDGVRYAITPQSPAAELRKKDERNHQICYEHITKDLKKLLKCSEKEFPKTEMTPREEVLLNYVTLNRISDVHRKMLGLKEECYRRDLTERLNIAENLTTEQKTMLSRMAIISYCMDMSEEYCDPDSVDIKLMTEFTDMHFAQQSQAVQERHKKTYQTRQKSLEIRIKAIEEEAELLQLRTKASEDTVVEIEGVVVDATTGELLQAVEAEPTPDDYPEPVIPFEPEEPLSDEELYENIAQEESLINEDPYLVITPKEEQIIVPPITPVLSNQNVVQAA